MALGMPFICEGPTGIPLAPHPSAHQAPIPLPLSNPTATPQDDWVSTVLRSLSSAPTPTTPTAPISKSKEESDPPEWPQHPVHSKRRRRQSEEDDSGSLNDPDTEDGLSDDVSEEEFASPAKRPKFPPSHGAIVGDVKVSRIPAPTQQSSIVSTPREAESAANRNLTFPIPLTEASSEVSVGTTVPNASSSTRRGHLPEQAIRYLKAWFFSHGKSSKPALKFCVARSEW